MKRADGQSLFLRFRHGSPNRIQMDIIGKIGFFVEESKNDTKPLKILKRLILPIDDGMGRGLSIDSTWFRLIEECYLIFDTDLCRKFNSSLLTELFNLFLTAKNIEEKWSDIRNFILENIDQFSMWNHSYNKIFAEERNIKRQEDGTYIEYMESEIYETIGSKTLEEEKFDYIMSATLSENGSVYNLLKFVAIVFISIDYQENPDKYPNSLNIFLPESDSTCWFLRWKWNLDRPYGYMKSGWRPYNNHCDPDWLVSDLLAKFSQETISEIEMKKFDQPNDEIIREYEEAFDGFPRQFACAIDSDLIIGEKEEVYFKFKDRKIRWINGTTYLRPIIVVPSKGLTTSAEDEAILNEFISSLVWETEIPIRKLFHASAAKRFSPIVGATKNKGGTIIGISKLSFDGNDVNKKQTLALALYKEGINSRSVYYSFLNYYKIMELLFFGRKQDIIGFINESRDLLISKGHSKRVNEIDSFGVDFGDYIYVSCRCAVAHAGQIDSTVNPDDIDDYRRITEDLPLIQEIAKNIIKSGRFNNET